MDMADPRIERYLCKDRPWRDELVALRGIILGEDVTEALKWRKPCFRAHDLNLGIFAAAKDHVVLAFFKGVLMDDPEGLLEAPGPNSRSARVMRFTSAEVIAERVDAIRNFIRQAIQIEKDRRTVDLPKDDFESPEALVATFENDPALKQAFGNLTPGRQRGYVLHINDAKQEKTQRARIARWRDAILSGKGMHDR